MHFLYQQGGSRLLMPDDIDDEITIDNLKVGNTITFSGAEEGSPSRVEIIDRIVCLKVKILERQEVIAKLPLVAEKKVSLFRKLFPKKP